MQNRLRHLGVFALFFGMIILPGSAMAQSLSPNNPEVLCAKLDLAVQGYLDDNPVAEHLPSHVRSMAAQYQMGARRECVKGRSHRAFDRYEIALALLGQPWTMRNITQAALR